MKKYFIFMLLALISLMLLISCDEPTNISDDITITDNINIEIEDETDRFEFGNVKNVDLKTSRGNFIIEKADGNKTTIEITGCEEFNDLIIIDYLPETEDIKISYDVEKERNTEWDNIEWKDSENNVIIKIVYTEDKLETLNFTTDLSGSVEILVPFKNLNIEDTNGSAAINAESVSFDTVNIDTNGSGDISFKNTRTLSSVTNGSCNINFNDAESCAVIINGSGIIDFNDAESCIVTINGSGIIDFNDTKTTSLTINGSGDIQFNDAESCIATINGSGYLSGNKINILDLSINSSGNMEFAECDELTSNINTGGIITIDKVNKSVHASLTREENIDKASDRIIEMKSGAVESFYAFIDAEINDDKAIINAKGITTDKAEIDIKNKGTVEIGKVIGELIENCGENAELIINE